MSDAERNTIPTSYNALISKFRAKCAQVEALEVQWAAIPWDEIWESAKSARDDIEIRPAAMTVLGWHVLNHPEEADSEQVAE